MLNSPGRYLCSCLSQGDSDKLKTVLGYIHQVRSSERSVLAMFQPLRDTVSVLKKHGEQERPESARGSHHVLDR